MSLLKSRCLSASSNQCAARSHFASSRGPSLLQHLRAPMADWYDKLRETVRHLRSRSKGCLWCSKNCLSEFAEPGQLSELRCWHGQWRSMSSKDQDSHLLWMFHGDEHQAKSKLADGLGMHTSTSSNSSDASDSVRDARPVDDGIGVHVSTSDSSDASRSHKEPPRKQRRVYKAGAPRQDKYSIRLLGIPLCQKAAKHLLQVGDHRLSRVLDGRPDMRSYCPHTPGPQISSVWRFLWTLYHNVAEGLPDKFSSATNDITSSSLMVSTSKDKEPSACSTWALSLRSKRERSLPT